jgi:hypothetical protein
MRNKGMSKKYILKAETGNYSLKGGNVEFRLKRGEASWAYFPLAYSILLTISIGIISVLEICYIYKILFIIVDSIALFYLCFFNAWFRNKIVGLFSRSKEMEEIRN